MSTWVRGDLDTKRGFPKGDGSAYRIRTGDLLLEREVSLTPRRMRQTTESTALSLILSVVH